MNKDRQLNNLQLALSAEAQGLDTIIQKGFLDKIIKAFDDYPNFIHRRLNNSKLQSKLKKASEPGLIFYSSTSDKTLREIFFLAHVAACCEMFRGMQIPIHSSKQPGIQQSISNYIRPNLTTQQLKSWEDRIHITDTIRTMEILRLMGLVDIAQESTRQLSLAAGSGSRDTDGINSTPKFSALSNPLDINKQRILSFERTYIQPEHMILVDNDPAYSDHYKKISIDHNDWLTALNMNADEAIQQIPELLISKGMSNINRIAGIRIDHRMIPNAGSFITSLLPLLDNKTDLIISIGAGHTLDEFVGRKKVMRQLHQHLVKLGLRPVLICLHNGKTPEEQRLNPSFGVSGLCTYEILYCRLIRQVLAKTLL